ncbi:methyltransferase domain-containing protein [Halolamina sp. CBA1230]|uniref:class I SAM-dependent methyltransferase n=1 Tax=Halolamina sp. CBA1230 TaxID=1853690 RepID=UPI0009A200DD|nr:methyltransferase domain-containing protein [Halolamina sp. CBA1230]QKY21309.1 methyltransferase domain-containing protein [Halolamina sp. CBA1230]
MTEQRHGPRTGVRQVWSTGRYPSLAPNLLPAVARLVNAANVTTGDRTLDVGCGTGNASIAAARAGGDVIGLDVTRSMLEEARENAAVAGLDGIEWLEGDAESLPFRDGSHAVTLSNFGHVFAPDPDRATAELIRVTESGGCVAFTAWSPDGLVGELTDVLADHLGEGAGGSRRHLEWGDSAYVREHVPDSCDLSFERQVLPFRYASPEHFWQSVSEAGPLSPVVSTLDDPELRADIRRDALDCLSEWFVDNAVRVEYLLVRATVE